MTKQSSGKHLQNLIGTTYTNETLGEVSRHMSPNVTKKLLVYVIICDRDNKNTGTIFRSDISQKSARGGELFEHTL